MTINEIMIFLKSNKEAITIIIASIVGVITIGTFIKAIIEYRMQGRQKRTDLFDDYYNRLRTDSQLNNVISSLEDGKKDLKNITKIDKYYFLGFYEQIAMAVNSGLIKINAAHYFFGYYAKKCWDSDDFWCIDENKISKDSYYWSTFKRFVDDSKKIEMRRIKPNLFQRLYDKIFYKRLYRF